MAIPTTCGRKAMEEMRLWLLALLMVGNLRAQPVSVAGTVVRPDGTPASFARIVLVAEPPFGKGEAIWQEGRCDQRGRFQLRLPYPSELPAVVIAHQSGVGIGWQRVRLTTSTEGVVPLLPSVSLTGRLRGGGGATLFVRQLRPIGLFNPHRLPLRLDRFVPDFLQTRTEADGRFAFADLPDGFTRSWKQVRSLAALKCPSPMARTSLCRRRVFSAGLSFAPMVRPLPALTFTAFPKWRRRI